jgi:NPCBM/NEW2 domain
MLRSRRRFVRPRIESLELRVTPSDVGVNLNFNASYAGDYIWVDVHNLFSTWANPNGSTPAPPVNANNYPLAPAVTGGNLLNYPDGDYQLSYQGTATVSFSGIGYLAGPVTTNRNGVSTGTVVIDHSLGDGKLLLMTVTGVGSTATMSNFHLYAPGYGSNPTQMFTNEFLNELKPFSTIRFENWNNVIGSTASTWQQRTPPGSFVATGTYGVPYEDMIELANEAQKDLWINIPALATPNYVQNLAQLINSELDPNLNVYVEYSDETWDPIWPEYTQVLQAAQSNPLVTAKGAANQVEQQSAYEIVSIAQIFDQVFGADRSRVRPIVAAFATLSVEAQTQLQFIQTNYGTPSQFVWGVAIAPYLNLPAGDDVPGLTLDQLFVDLNQYLNTQYLNDLKTNEAVARAYNLPLVSYEGGTSLSAVNGVNTQVKAAAQLDPRMYQLYVDMIDDWDQYVGPDDLFTDFDLNGPYSDNRFFGLVQSVVDPGSQKYDALLSEIYQGGDANLDGTVNYADFQILQANFGLSDTWWRKGDFNDDGVVNWSDLNTLRTNLDPASVTLSQFAQIALFGQPSAITTGQTPEYDGYGVTFVSDMPWVSSSNGQGPVLRNQTTTGSPIAIGSLSFSSGLGVYANSDVTVNLGGRYMSFQSDIGVDGLNSSSSVIFEVYGDGTLLYQSPVLTDASGAIPISLSVAGVQQLSLDVIGSTSNTTGDHAVWADSRLVSTANFNEDQVPPYTLTWQVSENGQSLLVQATDSFLFPYSQAGVYTVSLTVTDASGDIASTATTVTISLPVASATLINQNSVTQGNWIGTYGTEGTDFAGGPSNLPVATTATVTGSTNITWAGTSTDLRALQNTGGNGRLAAAWSSTTSFTINLNLGDGRADDIALYAVDWENQGISEQIQITSAATGMVLDTETLSDFSGGDYLDWRISGDVLITVTLLTGPNAVLSGLFLDSPPVTATLVEQDTLTQGNWIGTYGSQGNNVIGMPASYPSYASVSVSGQLDVRWEDNTTVPQAIQEPGTTNRFAENWSSTSSFVVTVNLNDGQPHDLALYAIDWADQRRSELIQVADAATGTILSTKTLSDFEQGVYLQWMITGSVTITVTLLSGPNAVLSGLFFDPPSSAASLIKEDITTKGNWVGSYGDQGQAIVGDAPDYPAYAMVTASGETITTWATSTTDPRALQNTGEIGQIAAAWSSSTSFAVDVDLTDGQEHDLALYAVDWDNQGRSEQIQVTSTGTGKVLDTETITNFGGGVYLQWVVSGDVLVTVTRLTGPSAVLSGLFMDAPQDAATLVNTDSTTKGSWIGSYGSQGYNVIGNAYSNPTYAIVQPVGTSTTTWAASTTDSRALQDVGGTPRIAASWYTSTSFIVDVDLTDNQEHDISLYALDWDGNNSRSEQIQISSATTGAILDTEIISKFSAGVYLKWAVTGNVVITVTSLSGANAVLSGLFFDPPSSIASLAKQDGTTQGNWIGAYGNQGYNVVGNGASYPAYATVKVSGETITTWAASTTDARALQNSSGLGRVAAAWSSRASFTVSLGLTGGQEHFIALYAVDWDGNNTRSEQIQITSASTGRVLDTEILSNFSTGVYLDWRVFGSVVITITRLAGADAVLSGVFFSSPSTPMASASLVKHDSTTQGNWIGSYGTQGYNIFGSVSTYPSYAIVQPFGESGDTWAGTTDPRALQDIGTTSRLAASWYSSSSFIVDVNLIDGQAHDIAIYALDWDGNNTRSEQIQIINAATGAMLDTEKVSTFSGGVYLQWVVTGNVEIKVTKLGGANAVLSGLFIDSPSSSGLSTSDLVSISSPSILATVGTAQNFTVTVMSPSGGTDTHYTGTVQFKSSDPQAVLPPNYTFTSTDAGRHTFSITLNTPGTQSITVTDLATATITGNMSVVVNSVNSTANSSASLIKRDTATAGAWIGVYGSQGYDIIGNTTSSPSYATVTTAGALSGTWAASTTDPRALQKASVAGRIAANWYSFSSFTINVNLTDGQAHDIALYALDWDGNNTRSEQIQIINAATGAVLDTEKVSAFSGGVYLQWVVTGNVVIKVTKLGGANAVLSGLFFDNPSSLGPSTSDLFSISSLSTTVATGVAQSLTVTAVSLSGGTDTHYTGTVQFKSSDPQAVLPANYTFTSTDAGRHTFSITLNTPGTQSITVTDLATATITGSISVTVNPAVSSSASLIKRDTSTAGTWIGAYGSQGYNVIGNVASYPSYATVTTVGALNGTWAASTTDSRALQKASVVGHLAACWYSFSSFTINVNLTDGQAHDITLYALDWDENNTRSEQIQIINAATGTVLDTEKVSAFSGGVYLQWVVTGNVVIKVTKLGGANAVLSGLFFDSPPSSGSTTFDHFSISSPCTTGIAGAVQSFTVTALSPTGGTDTHYTSTIQLQSSDLQAVLPANYTFTSTDAGRHTFYITLNTAGTQSITATDLATATITGSISVTVNPAVNWSASLIKQDTTTKGTWIGAYGSEGYNIVGNATSYPSYAAVTTAGALSGTWAASTTDPRALQKATVAGRIAANWYSFSSFTINVNLTDGQAHNITLYALDWDENNTRNEQIQITSAATGAVLDTEKVSSFSGGVYLQWVVTGNVVITVTKLGGANAVLSGLFFDTP